jgi:hypothetical protein
MGNFHTLKVLRNGSLHHCNVVTNSTLLGFVFDESANTVRLAVNSSETTFGFCRIQVPHALVQPEITVVIDDGLTEIISANYSLLDDVSNRWIFFAYSHSAHEIVIVPEYTYVVMLWLVSASLLTLLFKKARGFQTLTPE